MNIYVLIWFKALHNKPNGCLSPFICTVTPKPIIFCAIATTLQIKINKNENTSAREYMLFKYRKFQYFSEALCALSTRMLLIYFLFLDESTADTKILIRKRYFSHLYYLGITMFVTCSNSNPLVRFECNMQNKFFLILARNTLVFCRWGSHEATVARFA